MITNTKQNWQVGSIVKVGFMTLRVMLAVPTPGDYAPDAYLLTNMNGTQLYKFVPHNGVEKITFQEYNEMLEDSIAISKKIAEKAISIAMAK